jgi:hypothetical protein
LKTPITGKAKWKIILKEWSGTAFEVGKWLLVLWLLWPVRNANIAPVEFTRVVLGVLLFIIFAGKVFFDTVIMSIIRQRRTSAKRDIITLLGIVSVMGLVVGLLMFFGAYMLIEMSKNMTRTPGANEE